MFILTPKKQCSNCGETKPLSEFSVDRSAASGRKSHCKKCCADKTREWKRNNREKRNASKREYYTKNKERVLGQQRRAYSKYYQSNKEKVQEHNKSWLTRNLERVQEYHKQWYLENKEKVRENGRQRRINFPEKIREYGRTRRAKEKANGGKITAEEWQAVLDRYGHKCLHPGCERTDIEMDHVVPLKKGGTHTADNVQPLCVFHNRSKGTKVIDYR